MALGNVVGAQGSLIGDNFQQPQQPRNIRSVYDAAASTQAQDYDDIMQGYDTLLQRSGPSKLNYTSINPVFNRPLTASSYSRSPELGTALGGLSEYSQTGGYSGADISNIRERGISPIRSIYDAANRQIQRQKVLQGGYSPNLGAVTAKMARESAGQIGDITTRVNADIAQMVASGKLAGLQSLSSVAGRENELQNEINRENARLQNQVELSNAAEQRRVDELNNQMMLQIEEINNRNRMQDINTRLSATQGKQSLYGTTPALTQMFGNQVLANNAQQMQAVQTANTLKNQRANIGLNLVQNQLGPMVGGFSR